MTIWDNIYKRYEKTGEEYATLKKGLDPDFLEFMKGRDFKIKKALDVGCGNGKYLVYLTKLGFEISGIDSSPTAVEMAKEALGEDSGILCVDMYKYDYPKEMHDLVISIAAIHHGLKAQVANAIANIYSSLVAGGQVFITLPDNEGSSHWTQMGNSKEIESGVRVPLSGPEKGLPHASFTREEIREIFSSFIEINMKLLKERGRWIITGKKI
jgi:SAM-dependent methyltransferase